MNPNYLFELARQQPLRSDLMDPAGIPQTLSGLIAMENARNYAPAQYKFSPEQAQQFDQMAAAGQAELGRWMDAQQKAQAVRRDSSLNAQEKMLDIQAKQMALRGEKVKPQFVDGQWVYPPSADAPQGRAIQVEGFKKAEKPPTDDQAKAAGFGVRAVTSHEILNSIGNEGKVQPGAIKRVATATPLIGESLGTLTNWTQSQGQQQVEQAQRDFVNAILRRESGAVINPDEFTNATKQYFPQPGDSAAVIKQKKMNRENAISSLETSAGPIASQVQVARQKMQARFEAEKEKSGGQKQSGSHQQISTDAEYNALPRGSIFIDPNGNRRVKP